MFSAAKHTVHYTDGLLNISPIVCRPFALCHSLMATGGKKAQPIKRSLLNARPAGTTSASDFERKVDQSAPYTAPPYGIQVTFAARPAQAASSLGGASNPAHLGGRLISPSPTNAIGSWSKRPLQPSTMMPLLPPLATQHDTLPSPLPAKSTSSVSRTARPTRFQFD